MTTTNDQPHAPSPNQCRDWSKCQGIPWKDIEGNFHDFNAFFWDALKTRFNTEPAPNPNKRGWWRGPWEPMPLGTPDDDRYFTGDLVANSHGFFQCLRHHRSEAGDEPGVGPNWQTYWQPIDVGAQAQPPGYGLFTWTGYMALDVTGTERQEIHFDTTHFANGLDRTGGHIYPTTPDRVWDISLRFWGTTTAAVRVFAGSSSFGPSQSRALGLLILPAPRDQQSGDSFILLGAGAGKTTDKNPIGPITIGADSEDTAAIVAIDHVEMTVRELGTS